MPDEKLLSELTDLTEEGQNQAEALRDRLTLKPDLYLSSKSTHAWQTAEILSRSAEASLRNNVVTVWSLTPGGQVRGMPDLDLHKLTLSHIKAESATLNPAIDFEKLSAVVLVGHTPRVQQLLADVTRNVPTEIPAELMPTANPRARGASLEGTWQDFCEGTAKVGNWI